MLIPAKDDNGLDSVVIEGNHEEDKKNYNVVNADKNSCPYGIGISRVVSRR
jgi:hypothetical protein